MREINNKLIIEYIKGDCETMWLKIKVPRTTEIVNFAKHIKEKYNLKIQAIFHVLIEHPEILEEINEKVDSTDMNLRFKKYMND